MSGSSLRHFWFEFELGWNELCPPGAREGVGVTASDLEDALELVARRVFPLDQPPRIRRVIEDVSFHSLCPWAVLPNMLEPWSRGIWFPVGFAAS